MQRQVNKRQVQVIQPTINTGFMQTTLAPVVKKRVAAYARVSTEHEEQQTSYDAHYTKKIKERTDWVFVEVYTDKGITGTNTKRREGFNRMVKDALDGKIDLILTKSVSRFARNTVDSAIGHDDASQNSKIGQIPKVATASLSRHIERVLHTRSQRSEPKRHSFRYRWDYRAERE